MKYKVRVTKSPMQKAREGMQVGYGLGTPATAMGGASATNSTSEFATTKSITGVPRDEANLEAEGGETVYGDINGDGMPEQNTIKGPRHSEGGVPLNLPEGTFIFSDTKSMRIKDCEILEMFNKPCGKKSYTPATLAKVFDLNAYREILQDPNSDKLDVRTAERMLKNYTIKLGALALAQEAMKGFPQGIPAVAQPYIEAAGLSPEEILPPKEMTQLVDQLKQDQEAKQQPQPGPGGDPEMMQKAQQMNQGEPIAMPTDPQGAMTQDPMAQQQMMPPEMQQPQEMLGQPMPGMMPPQEQMMMFGGNYSNLNKFIDGGEEMMMQEQQAMQQQGPPQAQGGQDELMQIMQGVGQALEQGVEPTEIMAQLIQSEVPPEIIVQVFTELGMPEEEVMQNLQMIMQQMQGAQPAQEQQMMPPQPQQGMPMAAYGMQLGGFDMPFVMANGGAAQYSNGGAKQRVRITEIPLRQAKDGEIVIDKDDPKYKKADGSFNRMAYEQDLYNAAQSGDVIVNAQGQRLKRDASGAPIMGKYSPEWDASTMDADGRYGELFGSEDPANPGTYTMSDDQTAIAMSAYLNKQYYTEPGTMKLIAAKAREAALDSDNYDGKDINTIIAEYNSTSGLPPVSTIDDIPDEVFVNNLVGQDEQAKRIAAKGINTGAFKNSATGIYDASNPSKSGWAPLADVISREVKNPVTGELVTDAASFEALKDAYQDLGIDKGSGNLRGVYASSNPAMEQLSYLGFKKAAYDKTQGSGYTGDDAFFARYLSIDELGVGDNPEKYGTKKATRIDTYEGNTDLGQAADSKYTSFDWEDIPPEDVPEECNCKDGQVAKVVDGECICEEERIVEQPAYQPAAWHLQDTVNTFGLAGDRGYLEKDLPYDPGVDVVAPLGKYKDPTKELADNQAMFNIGADTAAQFAGIQGLTSRTSQMSGNTALQASKINQRYNNENINLANTIERGAADAYNKQSVADREVEKGIYDGNALANANFNKERLGFRLARRNQFNTAVTNKWKTDAMNQIYPDYAVDPSVGGRMAHIPNYRNANPNAGSKTWDDAYAECSQTTSDSKLIMDCIRSKGITPSSGNVASTGSAGMINAIYGDRSTGSYNTVRSKFGGATGYYVLGGNVYPF